MKKGTLYLDNNQFALVGVTPFDWLNKTTTLDVKEKPLFSSRPCQNIQTQILLKKPSQIKAFQGISSQEKTPLLL